MIIWSGLGFLVPALTFSSLVFAELTTEIIFANENFYQENAWPMAAGFLLAGLVVQVAAKVIKDPEPRMMVVEKTGERVLSGSPRHTFFFIPMKYWAFILPALGGVIVVVAAFSR